MMGRKKTASGHPGTTDLKLRNRDVLWQNARSSLRVRNNRSEGRIIENGSRLVPRHHVMGAKLMLAKR